MKDKKEFSNYRVCDHCHTATTNGYIVDVSTYACSDACLNNLVSPNERADLEEKGALYYTNYNSIDYHDDDLYTNYIYAAFILRHIRLVPSCKHALIVLLSNIFEKRDWVGRLIGKKKNPILSFNTVSNSPKWLDLVENQDDPSADLLAFRHFNNNLLVHIISSTYAKMPSHLQQKVLKILDPEGFFS